MSREGHFFSGAVNPIVTNSTLTNVGGDYNINFTHHHHHLHTSTSEHRDLNLQRGLETIKDSQLADKIEKWLSAPDSSRNYNEARKKYQTDTCSWFLEGARFHQWEEKAGFLWIKGTAGCGKTILCSSIINKVVELHKKDESNYYIYFFFDGRDSQRDLQQHDKLIRSLIWQLALQCNGIPAPLVQLHGQGHQPSTTALQNILHCIIDGLDSVYVVIDSLDECINRDETLQWIEQIISHHMDNLHLVVASRPERDIIDTLGPLDPRCMDLAEEVNHDIVIYLNQQLSSIKKWDHETRDLVRSTLAKGAHGMFRWVALQLLELKKCSNQDAVKMQLHSLPKGLYETYNRILSKIDNQSECADIKVLLQWLCFSVRPMKLEELAEAIAMVFDPEKGSQYTPSHRYWDERDVLDKCSGLVAESNGTVKLAHFSIKEYLRSEHLTGTISGFRLTEELSHAFIAQTCLAYLLQFDTPNSVYKGMVKSHPLAPYAAEHWIFHAQSGGIDKSEESLTLTLAKKLFTPGGFMFTSWVQMWDLDAWYPNFMSTFNWTNFAAPLYYASLGGLQQLSRHLSEGIDVNALRGQHGNVLQAAIHKKHEGIVQLLLEKGADINNFTTVLDLTWGNCTSGQFNALQVAAYSGNEAIITLLLEKGVDVNTQGGYYGNALQAASCGGHERSARMLLENGVDVNTQGGYYGNALQAALASYRGKTIAELLLERGADVNAQGGYFGNALQAASFQGYEGITKLLLEKGADVNAQGGKYGNALQAASYGGREAIVKLLLEMGANVNAQGGRHDNALKAARNGWMETNRAIETLLLENGAVDTLS